MTSNRSINRIGPKQGFVVPIRVLHRRGSQPGLQISSRTTASGRDNRRVRGPRARFFSADPWDLRRLVSHEGQFVYGILDASSLRAPCGGAWTAYLAGPL